LLTGELERSLPIMAMSKEARLLTWQLRAPGRDVPRGPGRCCKEASFRSPTVSLSLHSIGQASHFKPVQIPGKGY